MGKLDNKVFSILILTISAVLLFGISPAYAVGPIIIGGDDLTDHGFNDGELIGSGPLPGACDGDNMEGWLYVQNAVSNILLDEIRPGVHDVDILAFGSGPGEDCSDDAGGALDSAALKIGATVRHCNGVDEIATCFEDLASGDVNPKMFHMAGTGADNDISGDEGDEINSHASEIAAFVNSGGGLLAHGDDDDAFGWLPTLIPGFEYGGPCDNDDAVLTAAGVAAFPLITNADIRAGPCHDSFSGNFGGLVVFAFDSDGFPFILGAAASEEGTISGISSPGDVYVVTGRLVGPDTVIDAGSLATADFGSGLLSQVGDSISQEVFEGGGASGLAIDSFGRFYVTAVNIGGSGFTSELVRVDPGLAPGSIILDEPGQTAWDDPAGETRNVKSRDLAFHPETDVLFGVGKVADAVVEGTTHPNALFTIDTSDASIITLVDITEANTMKGIAFDPTDGTLYGVDDNEEGDCNLYTLSLTGFASHVTDLDICYDGLGIDSLGQIFGTQVGEVFDSLHLIDPSDGSDVTVAGEDENPSDVDFIVDNPIAEVHCDTEFHWDFEVFPDFGFRYEGEGDESTCTILYADGTEKVVEVSVSGDFGVDPSDFPLVGIAGEFHMEVVGDEGIDGIWIVEEGLVDYSAISEVFGDYLIETTGTAESMGIFGDLSECDVESNGEGVGLSSGTALRTIWIICDKPLLLSNNEDNAPYPRPHLGDGRYGGGHDNGFCMDQNCMDVRSNYFNHFPETAVNQGSTHTFTLLVSCQRGADTCIHASIGGALPDSTFYDTRWDASLDKDIMTGVWTLTTTNDHGEIGTVTGNVQTVGKTFIQVTFNVQFLIPSSVGTADGTVPAHENNRHLHVTLWDNQRGMSNYIFNDGMLVEDIYAYPVADMSFDPALEYEPLCLNEDSSKRHTCAFDKVKDWTIKNAEEKLKEMYDQRGQDMDSYDESEEYKK